jgi:hypothetical protein
MNDEGNMEHAGWNSSAGILVRMFRGEYFDEKSMGRKLLILHWGI